MVKSGIIGTIIGKTSENNRGENQEIRNRIIGRILGIIGLGLVHSLQMVCNVQYANNNN